MNVSRYTRIGFARNLAADDSTDLNDALGKKRLLAGPVICWKTTHIFVVLPKLCHKWKIHPYKESSFGSVTCFAPRFSLS